MLNIMNNIRDNRLMFSLLFFLIFIIFGLRQSWILMLYVDAAITGNWDYFSKMFSVQPPASGPNVYCFGRCASKLPFLSGWIAISSFVVGVIFVAHSWWLPKPFPKSDTRSKE